MDKIDFAEAQKNQYLVRALNEAKAIANERALEIVLLALENFALPQVSETNTTLVSLPNNAMKAWIIGRDGRNIRTFEKLTGATLIMDAEDNSIVISCFNPERRKIAELALSELIASGKKIQPSIIEVAITCANEKLHETIMDIGREAANSAKVLIANDNLIEALGHLQFRSSFKQNLLSHSLEVASLMGLMAGELNLDQSIARRIGLMHDIGKCVLNDANGNHADAGASLLASLGESAAVVDAVRTHHDASPSPNHYAALCRIADALSSSRPGARREKAQIYYERMSDLEKCALAFPGVSSAYAVQAGREIRIIVDPKLISDDDAIILSQKIAQTIECKITFPAQIKVIVVRETTFEATTKC